MSLIGAPHKYKLSNLSTFNARWASSYDSHIFARRFAPDWDTSVLSILQNCTPGATHLDVGCATGRLLEKIGTLETHELAGVDLAPRLLITATRRLETAGVTADLRIADVEQAIPWDSGAFDSVSLCGVIHHLYDTESALSEIRRVLKPGGRLIVADPWFPRPVRIAVNGILRWISLDGDCKYYSPRSLKRVLQNAGFHEFRQRRISWHSFCITAVC